MPQCKINYCREPAVYNRRWGNKRYCETHGHAYADKRDKALADRAKMPDCESGISPSCEGKVSLSRQSHGHTTCRWCEEHTEELRRKHEYEDQKWVAFHEAETVNQLKEWIKEYLS